MKLELSSPESNGDRFPYFATNKDGDLFYVYRRHDSVRAVIWAMEISTSKHYRMDGDVKNTEVGDLRPVPVGSVLTITI